MDKLNYIFRKLGILIRRKQFHRELEEEMAFHCEEMRRELQSDGMTSESAHRTAKRQFGNTTKLREQSYEVVGFPIETALQDLRFALRQLSRKPGFALMSILILALGVGASTAIFAFVDAALIKGLPYRDSFRLVGLFESFSLGSQGRISYRDYLDWKKQNTVFSEMEAYEEWGFVWRSATGAQMEDSARVSAGFFRALGITPVLGRDFRPAEDQPGSARTAMLSFAAWQGKFGGKRDVLGQTVTLDNEPYTIIGVLPRDFRFAPVEPASFWTPLDATGACERRRVCKNLAGVGRLRNGVSLENARAEMTAIAQQLERQYPDSNSGQGATVLPLTQVIVGDVRPVLLVLLSGAGLLFVISCVNIASLLLVRSESRRREIAVRGALGASRARLIRQFIVEGLVLVAGGGISGLATAYAATQLLPRLIPADKLTGMTYLLGVGLNLHVLIFAGAISLFAAFLFSIVPALRLPLEKMQEGLTSGGRGFAGTMWRRFGSNLVVVELAIAMMLLAGAGLLGKSLYRLLHVNVGFDPNHLAMMRVGLPESSWGNGEQTIALSDRLSGRLASLPGVKSVAVTDSFPVSSPFPLMWFQVTGQASHGEHNEVATRRVSSSYFPTMQMRSLRGRSFTEADDISRPRVVIMNEVLAKRYFPGEDPVGKHIFPDGAPQSSMEIVGVVSDIKEGELEAATSATIYFPFKQRPGPFFNIVIRTMQDEQSILPSVLASIHQVDPGIVVFREATMNSRIQNSPSAYLHRSVAWMVGGFAALALLLGVVGLYGVVAYSVSQRTREIGVRMALGARRSSVYQLVLKEAGWLTALGTTAGLICSVGAAILMRKLLFGVRAWDLSTLMLVATALALSALLASYFPARRAASVNPVEALRAE